MIRPAKRPQLNALRHHWHHGAMNAARKTGGPVAKWGPSGGFGPLVLLALMALLACQREPASPHTVVMAWEAFPLSMDPRLGQDQASQRLLSLTHQGLVRRDANLELAPDACSAWRWEVPFTVLDFEFPKPERARCGFGPGQPLTARDAMDAIEALRDPNLASPKAGPFKEEIAGLEAISSATADHLRIRLKAPDPGFPSNLARGVLGIAPAGARGERLPGSGPYRIVAVIPEQRILLEAKRDHPDFANHAGIAQDLDLRLMPDANTRLLALRHGSVQAALNNLPADLLRPGQGFAIRRSPGANLDYVIFNCRSGPLADAWVRRALSLALDRPSMIRGLFGGMAEEAWGFFPPRLAHGMDIRQELSIPSDHASALWQAAGMLDACGWRRNAQGVRFSLRLSSTAEVSSQLKALAIQAQWRALGVDVRILTREFGTLFSEVSTGKFEMASLRWTGACDPEMLVRVFHSRNQPPSGFNRGGFQDAEVDRLLDASHQANDPRERLALLHQAQRRILEQSPYAFLWWPDQIAALAPGLDMDLNGVGDFTGVFRIRP